jgi:hypothetical protein
MIGFSLKKWALGIGDKLICTSFPENYFHNTGEKIIDADNCWVFDHNPYVVRDEVPVEVIDLDMVPNSYPDPTVFSVAHRVNHHLGLKLTPLRHPRLYVYEDLPVRMNRVCVHAQGKDKEQRTLPQYVLDVIARRFQGCEIIQVGGENDIPTQFVDARGLPIWESIKLIATSAVFIGVDSSMQHVASAYPRVSKKVFLTKYSRKQLEHKVFPMLSSEGDYHWLDVSCQYFNLYEVDVGITFAYFKL